MEQEICVIDAQLTNVQQLCDTLESIWTKMSDDCFQDLDESVPRRIKAVMQAKGGPTHNEKGVPNQVAGEYIVSNIVLKNY